MKKGVSILPWSVLIIPVLAEVFEHDDVISKILEDMVILAM
tara:strand:+ start:62 stop:184 length:123 start_codon:yes stop_codon:yes gene_type:complete